jgi:hypothetical protein
MSLPTKANVRTARTVLNTLPELVVARRHQLGHGVRAAAEQMGIPFNNLSRIETRTSTNPKQATIEAILDYIADGVK